MLKWKPWADAQRGALEYLKRNSRLFEMLLMHFFARFSLLPFSPQVRAPHPARLTFFVCFLSPQVLSEQLIPFVAMDLSSERVQAGRAANLPVYFGDGGSEMVRYGI